MQDIWTTLSQRSDVLLYACVAIAVMLTVQAVGMIISRTRQHRGHINRRLQVMATTNDREVTLVQLRRDRGLTEDGSFSFKMLALNRLLMQSGIGTRSAGLYIFVFAAMAVGYVLALMFFQSAVIALPSALVIGLGLPFLFLVVKRKRRRNKFAAQLPEALDVMVRSMRAGHPIPVAVALVGREQPDPIGSEFGMTADEMTYGLDLETALHNMCERVGQEDLPFVVIAVSIQSKTGGNLAEVLSNLSRVIRDRFKLRRRVTAMSAEGRMSAAALSLIPLFVFLMLNLTAPDFYGAVRNDPIVVPIVIATCCVWATGILVIYRLVNFKY